MSALRSDDVDIRCYGYVAMRRNTNAGTNAGTNTDADTQPDIKSDSEPDPGANPAVFAWPVPARSQFNGGISN